jgi:hypothetical protein
MEHQDERFAAVSSRQALYFFIVLCVILILIILFSQYSDESTLTDEIYLRSGVAQVDGN